MADNYLEKKMEEHQRGAVHTVARRLTPTGQKPGFASFRIGEPVVYIKGYDAAPAVTAAVVRAFRNAGCRVAFSATDTKGGRELAQKSGARYYPLRPDTEAKVAADYGATDYIIDVGESRLSITADDKTVTVERSSNCPADVFAAEAGNVGLYLILSYSRSLLSGRIAIDGPGKVSAL